MPVVRGKDVHLFHDCVQAFPAFDFVHPHQIVEGHAEEGREGDEQGQIGQSGGGLPFRNGLTGHPDALRQLLLGQIPLAPQTFQIVGNVDVHWISSRIREPAGSALIIPD